MKTVSKKKIMIKIAVIMDDILKWDDISLLTGKTHKYFRKGERTDLHE